MERERRPRERRGEGARERRDDLEPRQRERVVQTEPESKSILSRIFGALFATAVGVLAFIGLLVILAIVLIFAIF